MNKVRCLLVLVFLNFAFSGCTVKRPFATSVEDIDPAGTGYERITRPYYKKKVKTSGAIINVVFTGAGAAGGYFAGQAIFNTSTNNNGVTTTTTNGGANAACAVGGAAVGYLVTRLFLTHSHKPIYVNTSKDYRDWLVTYDKRKKKDYLFIDYPDMYTDNSMIVLPKKMETQFKPRDLRDLRIFASLFPNSLYTDTAIFNANPMLTTNELDTLIGLYPDRPGTYASKVEYVGRFKTESDFKNALDKYNDAQAGDSIQIKYAQVIRTYPFAKDFLIRYPHSLYFDPVYQQLYTSLSWDQLGTIIDLYPTIPFEKATHARIEFFEMASTFHDLLAAVMKYPEAIYAVKPYDNLNTEDSAKNVFDRLVAYKPTSLMNNIPRVVSNLPEEFLVLQNKTTNPEGIDSLSSLTNRPWVQTDSATDIIDVIRSKYAKSKGVDQFVGVHLTASYDTGTLYKHDGTILKGKLKDQQDIIGFGEKVSTTGNKEIGNFTDGQLNGQGKQILPGANIIEEGNFKDGRMDGLGKSTHLNYVDSGIFRGDKLDNQGQRTYNNGNQYVGNFLDAKFSGYGTFTWSGGRKSFKGTFVDGIRQGAGELDFDNGYVVYGTWKDDCPSGDITVEKGVSRSNIEWSTTWTIKNCMPVDKKDPSLKLPFADVEILEKLPVIE